MSEKKIGRPRRRGRPNKDPNYVKGKTYRIRVDANDEMAVYNLSKWLGISEANVFRYAIRCLELDVITNKADKNSCSEAFERYENESKRGSN